MSDLLDGIRFVELGLFALVPAAAAVLAEWGADVVKVEHPVEGDPVRGLAAWGIKPGTGGFSYMWEVCNKGKRSVGFDVAHPDQWAPPSGAGSAPVGGRWSTPRCWPRATGPCRAAWPVPSPPGGPSCPSGPAPRTPTRWFSPTPPPTAGSCRS